jgi:hypothetical protein
MQPEPVKNITTVQNKPNNNKTASVVVDQNKYLERLWAYLTLKTLQNTARSSNKISLTVNKGNAKKPGPNKGSSTMLTTPTPEMTDEEKILDLAMKYHFVTDLTSLIITKENLQEDNFMDDSGPPIIDESPIETAPTVSSVVPKSFTYLDPNACNGTLELFSQTYFRGKEEKITSSIADLADFGQLVSSINISGTKTQPIPH